MREIEKKVKMMKICVKIVKDENQCRNSLESTLESVELIEVL